MILNAIDNVCCTRNNDGHLNPQFDDQFGSQFKCSILRTLHSNIASVTITWNFMLK